MVPTAANAVDVVDTADASPTAVSITEGTMTWGIKESWRTYVGADFTTVEEGATRTADGLFSFPLTSGSYDSATQTTTLTFAGSVHFEGYCSDYCLLDTRYGNFSVEIGPDRQVVRGDWAGRLQEDPAAGIETRTGVDLATLDIASVALDTSATRTFWPAIPSAATSDFVTYPAGTRLDPVTIDYVGPGGAPDLEERWDSPGAPVYDAGAQWISDKKESNTRVAYPTADGQTVVIVQGATGQVGVKQHSLIAADPITLEPRGEALVIPQTGGVAMIRTAFDAETGAVFWPSVSADTVTINRSVWNPGTLAFDTEPIGDLPAGSVAFGSAQITSFAWNPVNRELAVISGVFSFADPQSSFTVFRSETSGWTSAVSPLDIPADLRAQYEGSLDVSIPFGMAGLAPNLAFLPDGSAVLAGGGSVSTGPEDWSDVTTTPIPAFHIVTGATGSADGIRIEAIDGAEPVNDPYGMGYGHASVAADGSVLLTTGLGIFRPVSLVDGAVVVGDEFTLDVGGNVYASPTVVGDPATGLTLTTNLSAKRLLAFRDGALVGTQELPLINGYYPEALTIGPDGSLYLQIRTADGLGGIQRYSFAGTVPEITSQPVSVVVDTATGATTARFSVETTGTPEPTVRWQSKPVGQTAFADIEGATSAILDIPVTPTDDGTAYRAVVTSSTGTVASEVATATVLSAPAFVQQPVGVTLEPGDEAVFQVLASGNPEPVVTWEQEVGSVWQPVIVDGQPATGSRLVIPDAREAARIRAVATNDHGTTASNAVALSVVTPTVHADGSITGTPNAAGAYTTVSPAVELATDGSAVLSVAGSNFTKGTNKSGLYVLFGYVESFPSEGGTHGSGYAYIDGEENQRFIAWPGAGTAGAANALFEADGSFTVEGLVTAARFSAGSEQVDCLDGSVRCGVLTIGAHGQRDAGLETFTPVYFAGQEAPPITPLAPVVLTQPAAASATVGESVRFEATASGYPAPEATWQVLAAGETEWTDVQGGGAGASALAVAPAPSVLELDAVTGSQDGSRYRAVFSNAAGQVVTEEAELTVSAVGEPEPTPAPTPTVPAALTASDPATGASGATGQLPRTGTDPGWMFATALLALLAGAVLLVIRRRTSV
jgi:LPXTG-motif cell wall-anchored protein